MKLFTIWASTLLLLQISVKESSGTDYCDPKLCNGTPHIGCKHTGAFGPACAHGAKIMVISPDMRKEILAYHNTYRNNIAWGVRSPYKSAVRMAIMQWDEELANLAVLNVKRCLKRNDGCRGTDKFPLAGQNLAENSWANESHTVLKIALEQITTWYLQLNDADESFINSYSIPKNGKVIESFITLIHEKSTHVGCGIARHTKNGKTYQNMACNYAFRTIHNKPVYVSGTRASECTTGTDPVYTGLCSSNEKVDVHKK